MPCTYWAFKMTIKNSVISRFRNGMKNTISGTRTCIAKKQQHKVDLWRHCVWCWQQFSRKNPKPIETPKVLRHEEFLNKREKIKEGSDIKLIQELITNQYLRIDFWTILHSLCVGERCAHRSLTLMKTVSQYSQSHFTTRNSTRISTPSFLWGFSGPFAWFTKAGKVPFTTTTVYP